MAKTTAKNNNTDVNLGFEAKLWVAVALLPKFISGELRTGLLDEFAQEKIS